MKNGHFVISLDFELHWGLFDLLSVQEYQENLVNVNIVVDRLLDLCKKYDVKLTFATVGFLFAKNRKELIKYSPSLKPTYKKEELNPYALFNEIGNSEKDDPYHFGHSILKKIQSSKAHEIGTHTFSHYYCNEAGQTIEQFTDDIKSAINIANNYGIATTSIVFPRNMVNPDALDSCEELGISSYRGTEKAYIYRIDPKKKHYDWLLVRGLRLLDSYVNITGNNIYDIVSINKTSNIINLPSSAFLRPYSNSLKSFEKLKLRRIKNGMRRAAKQNKLYHLWWHPHNFGANIDENFNNLEKIFQEYHKLNNTHNFSSETMTSLANKILHV